MSSDPHCIEERALLAAIQQALPRLEALHHRVQGPAGQDLFYRFYHQSLKVYGSNVTTAEIVEALQALAPHLPLAPWFLAIVADAAGRTFSRAVNPRLLEETRPLVEALLHASMFLAFVVHAGRTHRSLTATLPSDWAAVLELYQIR